MTTATINTTETMIPATETWSLDPSHTQVGFAVKHLMIANVKGRFTDVKGFIRLDPDKAPEVSVSIDAASITTGTREVLQPYTGLFFWQLSEQSLQGLAIASPPAKARRPVPSWPLRRLNLILRNRPRTS